MTTALASRAFPLDNGYGDLCFGRDIDEDNNTFSWVKPDVGVENNMLFLVFDGFHG